MEGSEGWRREADRRAARTAYRPVRPVEPIVARRCGRTSGEPAVRARRQIRTYRDRLEVTDATRSPDAHPRHRPPPLAACCSPPGPPRACGGLVGENGSIALVRTTTLAAWHDGVEHYVTSFEFSGTGESVGLDHPAARRADRRRARRRLDAPAPADRGGSAARAAGASDADRGAAAAERRRDPARDRDRRPRHHRAVRWRRRRRPVGASTTASCSRPTRPEVLDFYAERSPVFLAAKFDASRAAEQGLELRAGHAGAHHHGHARAPGCRCGSSASGVEAERARAGRRLPPHRRRAASSWPAATASTWAQRAGHRPPARRPPQSTTGHGVDARGRCGSPTSPSTRRPATSTTTSRPAVAAGARARRPSTPACSSPASTAPTRPSTPPTATAGASPSVPRSAASAVGVAGAGGGPAAAADRAAAS